jgi:hypothetical protein
MACQTRATKYLLCLVTTIFLFSLLPKNFDLKYYNFFDFLYHINHFFITIQIKKLTTKLKKIYFSIQIISILYHINNFLLLFKNQKLLPNTPLITFLYKLFIFYILSITSYYFSKKKKKKLLPNTPLID